MIQLKVWLLRAEEIKAQLIFFKQSGKLIQIFFTIWKYTLGQNSNFLQKKFQKMEFWTCVEIKRVEEGSWFFCYLTSTFENKALKLAGTAFLISMSTKWWLIWGGWMGWVFGGIFNCHEMYTFFDESRNIYIYHTLSVTMNLTALVLT